MSKTITPLHAACLRLGGLKRTGTPQQVAEAERVVATLRLERYIEEALDADVDFRTRRALARKLLDDGGAK